MTLRQVVIGPPLSPPRLSILTAAQVVDEPDERWGNGAAFEPESCGGDVKRIALCPPAPVTKTTGERPASVDVDPFAVVASDTCSAFGFEARDFVARARRKLDACEAKQIEEEIWTGSLVPGNAHFASAAANDISATSALAPERALADLEDALADCSCGGRGMIHMTRRAAILLCNANLLRREGGLLLTCLDTVVVPGAGYPGTGPTGALPAVGEYLYATGMVQVRRGPAFTTPANIAEGIDRTVNTVTVRAERAVMALFDPCCLLAIRADTGRELQGS